MKVYCTGTKARRQASFTMSVAPATMARNQEIPQEWLDPKGNPVQFNLEFVYGEAEVDDAIARLLLDQKLVQKTKLLLPRLPSIEEEQEREQQDYMGQGG
jgi:hypothetical protein